MAKKLKPMVRLTEKQISDKLDYIENYKDKSLNAATASAVDSNANITTKNIATLQGELYKDFNIQVKRTAIKRILTEKYGEEFAKEYEDMIEKHLIYIHDETGVPGLPYCASITLYPILERGLLDFGGCSVAPKHLESFCGTFINLVYACTSNLAGAIATAEFLLYFHYFAVKDYGPNYLTEHYETIKNKMENVVYCINTPSSARSFQSCFWNISVYDKYYFDALFGNFTFPDGTKVLYEDFLPIQEFFMEWFLNERKRALLTFPVVTDASLNTPDGKPKDEPWADYMADLRARGLSFFSYNSKSASALSSCCLTPESVIEVYTYHNARIFMRIDEFYQSVAQNAGNSVALSSSDYAYSIDTGMFVNAFYKDAVCFERKQIIGLLKKQYSGPMYKFTVKGIETKCTPDHQWTVQKKDTNELVTIEALQIAANPSNYMALCVSGHNMQLEDFDSVVPYTYSGPVYDIEVQDHNHFIVNNVVTHNCRLRSEIDDNEFQYSLGGGGSIQTGSMQVITLNLLRLIATGTDLTETINKIHKILMAYKVLINEAKDAGLLPIYTAGFLNIDKQFLTIGINGLNEAAEYKGLTVSNNSDYLNFCKDIFETISNLNKAARKEYKQKFNTELVPAESLGIKNCDWDKKDKLYNGYRNCYNSYIYLPECDKTSIPDKFMMHGFVCDYIDGGTAAHINIAQLPSAEVFKWLDLQARKHNCNYWTTNVKSTCCNECGFIDFRTLEECPKCGSKDISYATRVIGYLKMIKHYSEGRQKEADTRYYH